MSNYSSKILNNSKSALAAQQALLATISNNIANVNTPGYTRRVVDLETRAGQSSANGPAVGNGVNISGVTRVTDPFLEKLLTSANSEKGGAEVQLDYLKRMEGIFDLTGDRQTIGNTLTRFWGALDDLTTDPSSLELRSNVMERAQDLVDTIRNSYNQLGSLQREADNRLQTEVQTINSLTSKIAELNNRVAQRELSGQAANDERDQRDVLLNQLAEKMSFTTTELADGSVSIFLSNGFAVVNGATARQLETTSTPSFVPPGGVPMALDGGNLNYVVFDYDTGAGTAHIDLTQQLKAGGGIVGGLLNVRGTIDNTATGPFDVDGSIVEVASRVEAIARTLLQNVNTVYLGPDQDAAVGHQPSSGDLDGNTPGVYGLFDFDYTGPPAKDVDADGLPNDIGNHNVTNYASLLRLAFTDPRRLAAARSETPPNTAAVFASGNGENARALARLQNSTFILAVGSYSFTGTLEGAYTELVTKVGNDRSNADLRASVATDNFISVSNRRDAVSGVSLDEEFTSLIKSQKAFQASARMVRLADELMEQIVSLL